MMPMFDSPSPATADLGLGSLLGQQVKDETEEERKKRLQQMQQQGMGAASMLGLSKFGASDSAGLGSLAGMSFGGR